LAPILVPVAIWIYTLVFAFSSLWFTHYTLEALEQLRKKNSAADQQLRAPEAPELISTRTVPEDFNKEIKEIKELM